MTARIPGRWEESNIRKAVLESITVREVISKLGLVPAGGNYAQYYFYIRKFQIDTSHFKGQAWHKGISIPRQPIYSLEELFIAGSRRSRRNLKRRLFNAGLKKPECEECGWAEKSIDGRLPIELDHINGDNTDNRLENLRILCPNCHSLKLTHRGSNIRLKRRDGGIGYTRDA
ncbi:MAG: hypothetical protein AB199_02300 [Parcubacteria bacterium C7867-004]|nr:MAG: hypothetical protein AB199_02300 [Parcubacteria bacterium C7867-004]